MAEYAKYCKCLNTYTIKNVRKTNANNLNIGNKVLDL